MEEQVLHKVSDRIWYMDPTASTDRPALGYVRGDRISLMIDAGNSPAHVKLFYEKLTAENLPLPSLCLITHCHWDHTFGIPALGIPAVCCEKTAEYIRNTREGRAVSVFNKDECVRGEYKSPDEISILDPDMTFTGELTINLGGVSARFIHTGGPHSDDSCVICIPEEEFVFGGDSSSGNFSLPGIPYDIPLLDGYEEKLKGLDFGYYLHSHRPLMSRAGFFEFLDTGRKRGYYTFD